MHTTYLDCAATSVPDPDIIQGMAGITETYTGNPSSIHRLGRESAAVLEKTRTCCAELLGVDPAHIVFTSGGTEANNLIISSFIRKKSGYSVVSTGIEHPSVFEPVKQLKEFGAEISIVKGKKTGLVAPGDIAESINEKTDLVAVMYVSNDTGAVQQIEEIGSIIRDKERTLNRPIHFHCDMVQALGKIPVTLNRLPVDSAAFSSHKIKGPRGAGILYIKKPLPTILTGGEQEYGIRPGTENLAAIWGLGEAMKKYVPNVREHFEKASRIKAVLLEELCSMEYCRLIELSGQDMTGPDGARGNVLYSPFITAVLVPPVPGEVLVRVMSDNGYAISTGSACSRSAKKRSRPLKNIGLSDEEALSAIRISIGYDTKAEDIRGFCDTLRGEAPPLLKISKT